MFCYPLQGFIDINSGERERGYHYDEKEKKSNRTSYKGYKHEKWKMRERERRQF